MSKQYIYKTEIVCAWCKETATVNRNGKRTPRFCGRSCSAKWRMRQPEVRAAVYTKERGIKITNALRGKKRPDSSIRMSENNPMWMKGVIDKMKATKGANGTLNVWKGKRGGNGQLTPQQLKLKGLLGNRWVMEFPIKTGLKSPYPTAYKVDLARKRFKLAVEVDGAGHRTYKVKLRDRKKDALLSKLGWTVLRFTNEQIDKTPNKVMRIIRSYTA